MSTKQLQIQQPEFTEETSPSSTAERQLLRIPSIEEIQLETQVQALSTALVLLEDPDFSNRRDRLVIARILNANLQGENAQRSTITNTVITKFVGQTKLDLHEILRNRTDFPLKLRTKITPVNGTREFRYFFATDSSQPAEEQEESTEPQPTPESQREQIQQRLQSVMKSLEAQLEKDAKILEEEDGKAFSIDPKYGVRGKLPQIAAEVAKILAAEDPNEKFSKNKETMIKMLLRATKKGRALKGAAFDKLFGDDSTQELSCKKVRKLKTALKENERRTLTVRSCNAPDNSKEAGFFLDIKEPKKPTQTTLTPEFTEAEIAGESATLAATITPGNRATLLRILVHTRNFKSSEKGNAIMTIVLNNLILALKHRRSITPAYLRSKEPKRGHREKGFNNALFELRSRSLEDYGFILARSEDSRWQAFLPKNPETYAPVLKEIEEMKETKTSQLTQKQTEISVEALQRRIALAAPLLCPVGHQSEEVVKALAPLVTRYGEGNHTPGKIREIKKNIQKEGHTREAASARLAGIIRRIRAINQAAAISHQPSPLGFQVVEVATRRYFIFAITPYKKPDRTDRVDPFMLPTRAEKYHEEFDREIYERTAQSLDLTDIQRQTLDVFAEFAGKNVAPSTTQILEKMELPPTRQSRNITNRRIKQIREKLKSKKNRGKNTHLILQRTSKGHSYLKIVYKYNLAKEVKLPKDFQLSPIDDETFSRVLGTIELISKSSLTPTMIEALTIMRQFTGNRETISMPAMKTMLATRLTTDQETETTVEDPQLEGNPILSEVGISLHRHPCAGTHFFIQFDKQKFEQAIAKLQEKENERKQLFESLVGKPLTITGDCDGVEDRTVTIGIKDWEALARWQEEMEVDSDKVAVIAGTNGKSRMFIVGLGDLKAQNDDATIATTYQEHMAAIDEEEGSFRQFGGLAIQGRNPEDFL